MHLIAIYSTHSPMVGIDRHLGRRCEVNFFWVNLKSEIMWPRWSWTFKLRVQRSTFNHHNIPTTTTTNFTTHHKNGDNAHYDHHYHTTLTGSRDTTASQALGIFFFILFFHSVFYYSRVPWRWRWRWLGRRVGSETCRVSGPHWQVSLIFIIFISHY